MGSGAYAAAKGGVIGLTYDLAYSHGRDGIRVNCIAPGHLFTPMGNQGGEELRERRRRAGLLGTEGTAWDAAWAVLFLASEESRLGHRGRHPRGRRDHVVDGARVAEPRASLACTLNSASACHTCRGQPTVLKSPPN